MIIMKSVSFSFLFIFLIFQEIKGQELPFNQPPEWSKQAIWYQIFIERFRDGNPGNNPTIQTCEKALFDAIPESWTITPWNHDWYTQENWAKETGLDFNRTIQMRRYGGDLDGVLDKIPYLKKLGVNAIYFNPLNDAPSLHKYDARNYHHIDITLGDSPEKDTELIKSENPADPASWTWTTADQKFISLVEKLHFEGIRVILDFSWNHTGTSFWAFNDIKNNLEDSPYKDWYELELIEDPETGNTQLTYEGWLGVKSLPELKKVNTKGKIAGHPYEGDLHPEVKKHIFEVTKRWMDPNQDGKFGDGIDGMRLDVAEHVPVGFWKDFRKFTRSINPEFYLVGENWWTKWPHILMDPGPWVKGDIFDAVMHYQWYKVARGYFAQPEDKLNLKAFRNAIDSLFLSYPDYTQQAMMNLSSSHDAPRLLTCFANPNVYKYNASKRDNPDYITGKPSLETIQRVKLFLLHQFTFVGSPHIWNGDEMGMTGADDPDCRQPLIWPDLQNSSNIADQKSLNEISDSKYQEEELFPYYQSLISLRKSYPSTTYGNYSFINLNDESNILAYTRNYKDKSLLVVFNVNSTSSNVKIPDDFSIYNKVFENGKVSLNRENKLELEPFSGAVFTLVQK
jgi:cyclomaltodextrinase